MLHAFLSATPHVYSLCAPLAGRRSALGSARLLRPRRRSKATAVQRQGRLEGRLAPVELLSQSCPVSRRNEIAADDFAAGGRETMDFIWTATRPCRIAFLGSFLQHLSRRALVPERLASGCREGARSLIVPWAQSCAKEVVLRDSVVRPRGLTVLCLRRDRSCTILAVVC